MPQKFNKLLGKFIKKNVFRLPTWKNMGWKWKNFTLITGITGIATGIASSMGFFSKIRAKENEGFEDIKDIGEETWHNAIPREQLIIYEMAIDRTVGESDPLTVRNLVIKGGGPKGAAYPGALKELAIKLDGLQSIERIAGASAGSIMAVLVAVGYTPEEIQEFLHEKDQGKPVLLRFALDGDDKFTDDYVEELCQTVSNARYPWLHIPWLLMTNFTQTSKLLYKLSKNRGICKGDYFEEWLNKKVSTKIVDFILAQPENKASRETLEIQYQWPTLGQLQDLVEKYGYQHFKHIYIVTATLGEAVLHRSVYTSESMPILEKCRNAELNHRSNVTIASAVRVSMSIPMVFSPAQLKIVEPITGKLEEIGEPLGMDGGVLENYPITVFDYNIYQRFPDPGLSPLAHVKNPETLGLFLYDRKELSLQWWLIYQAAVLLPIWLGDKLWPDTLTPDKNFARRLKSHTLKGDLLRRHILIDNCGVKLTEFDLPPEKAKALHDSGRKGVINYQGGDGRKLNIYYQEEQQRKKMTLSRMKKQLGPHSNIDEYPANEHYEVPQQFNLLMKQLKTQKPSELKLVIEGFGGSGKTELGHYLARRYMEACFWAQWSEGRFQRGDVIQPVVWRWQAETTEGLWSSLASFMQRLNIPFETSRERLPNENDKDYETRMALIVEKTLNGLLPTLSHGYVLWLFDNVEKSKESNISLLPAFKNYWTKLPKQAFGFITTRDRNLFSIRPRFSLDMEEGMGVRAAMRLVENITELNCNKEFVEQLDCLPLSLVLAGHYIRAQRKHDESFDYAKYLELHKIRRNRLGNQLEKDPLEKKEGEFARELYEKELTQKAVLLQQIELLQKYHGDGESYQLMQFCSLLAAEHISQDLLETFIQTRYPEWNKEECQIALENNLKVLKSYSLLKQGQDHQGIPNFIQHRQIQTAVQSQQLAAPVSKIVLESMLQYIKQQEKQAQPNAFSFKISVALLQHLDSVCSHYQTEVNPIYFKEWLSLIEVASRLYFDLGDYLSAKKYYEKILEIEIINYGENNIKTAKTLMGLGNVYNVLGIVGSAKEFYEKALEIQSEYYGENHIETANAIMNLGTIYYYLGDYVKAKEFYEKALKIQTEYYGENHIETASAVMNLGTGCYFSGDITSAKNLYKKALKINIKHYGDEHIETANPLMNLGNIYLELGNIIRAKKYYEKALKINIKHYGDEHIQTANALMNLGRLYSALGETGNAKKYHEKALNINIQHYGENHFLIADSLAHLGRIYQDLSDPINAKKYYEKVLKIETAHYGKDHIKIVPTLMELGGIYYDSSEMSKAIQCGEKALKIQVEYYGEDHIGTADVLMSLSSAYSNLGNLTKAKEYQEIALNIYSKANDPFAKHVKKSLEELEQNQLSNIIKNDKLTAPPTHSTNQSFFKPNVVPKKSTEIFALLKQIKFNYCLSDDQNTLVINAEASKKMMQLLENALQLEFKEQLIGTQCKEKQLLIKLKDTNTAPTVIEWLKEQSLTVYEKESLSKTY